jgi:hypothetical protein
VSPEKSESVDCTVERIELRAWQVTIGQIIRIIRFRKDIRTFAPWDVTTPDGHRLWAAFTLESACEWVRHEYTRWAHFAAPSSSRPHLPH